MDADREAIRGFLDLVQSTPRGRALVVNMLDSLTEDLFPRAANLREFLMDCIGTYADDVDRGPDVLSAVAAVCRGDGVGKRSYVRQCRQQRFSTSDRERLSNTLKTESFARFLVGTQYKSAEGGLPVVLPLVPIDSPSGRSDYERRLADVTSDPEWYSATATIGRPLPEPTNCWLTTDQFGPDPNAPVYAGDLATQVRDELGLIDYGEGSCLLRLSFGASSLAEIKACEVARPTFSDLGNSRFRANQSSSRAESYARAGWGATVHLGKLGDGAFSDSTGVAERVSTSPPLSALAELTVEFLGRVGRDRGLTSQDDDEAFAQLLEAGRATEVIRNSLLSLLD